MDILTGSDLKNKNLHLIEMAKDNFNVNNNRVPLKEVNLIDLSADENVLKLSSQNLLVKATNFSNQQISDKSGLLNFDHKLKCALDSSNRDVNTYSFNNSSLQMPINLKESPNIAD
jgi:hypothetical protein